MSEKKIAAHVSNVCKVSSPTRCSKKLPFINNRSTEDKFLTWLVFEHVLLLVKVLIHIVIPDQAASLTIIKARQRSADFF